MTTTEHLRAAERFAAEWAGKGDEKKDCQKFWLQLLGSVLGMGDAVYGEVEFEHHSRARDLKGFIDVRIPKSGVLVEQKSHDVDLVRDLTAGAFGTRYESDLLEVSSTPRIRGRHLRAGRGRSNRRMWRHYHVGLLPTSRPRTIHKCRGGIPPYPPSAASRLRCPSRGVDDTLNRSLSFACREATCVKLVPLGPRSVSGASEESELLKSQIEKTAQAILDARAKYPEASLADLYGEAMFLYPELVAAHRANDAAVCAAYGFPPDLPEPEIVSRLFALYQQLTSEK